MFKSRVSISGSSPNYGSLLLLVKYFSDGKLPPEWLHTY